MGDDDKQEPVPLVPVSQLPVAIPQEEASGEKLIDDLQDEAVPKPKRCPHCGGELPRE